MKDGVRIVAVPMAGPQRLGTVDLEVAPDVVGLASDTSAQILETVCSETQFVEVVASLPFPHDAPIRSRLVDALIPDEVWTQRWNLTRHRHQNEAVAVLEQFPVVVLAGGTAGRLGPPLPDLLARPRQLTDSPVAVDAARRVSQLAQLNADIAHAAAVERGHNCRGQARDRDTSRRETERRPCPVVVSATARGIEG